MKIYYKNLTNYNNIQVWKLIAIHSSNRNFLKSKNCHFHPLFFWLFSTFTLIFWSGLRTMLSRFFSYHWCDWASIHFDVLDNLIALKVLPWKGHFTGAFHAPILRSDLKFYLANHWKSSRLCLSCRICRPNGKQLRRWSLISFYRLKISRPFRSCLCALGTRLCPNGLKISGSCNLFPQSRRLANLQ